MPWSIYPSFTRLGIRFFLYWSCQLENVVFSCLASKSERPSSSSIDCKSFSSKSGKNPFSAKEVPQAENSLSSGSSVSSPSWESSSEVSTFLV